MKTRCNRLPWLVLPATLLLSACVTINIYFPASAAEKAADTLIEEIWQMRGEERGPASPAAPAAAPKEKTE